MTDPPQVAAVRDAVVSAPLAALAAPLSTEGELAAAGVVVQATAAPSCDGVRVTITGPTWLLGNVIL